MARPSLTFSSPIRRAQVDLRVDLSLSQRLAFTLPPEPNTWSSDSHGWELLWLGPDEWLIVAGELDGESLAATTLVREIDAALDGVHHAAVEVSANRATFDVGGPARWEFLSHGCAVDLHPRSWRDGMCAQSLLARVPVLLQERATSTRIYVRSSYVDYIRDWLFDTTSIMYLLK
jgi:sarcosine oxidase, subunit gamma